MSDTKKCPYCAEEIKEEAIKCKHCGEFLNEEIEECTVIDEQIKKLSKKCDILMDYKKHIIECDKVIKCCDKALKSNPNDGDTWLKKGKALQELEESKKESRSELSLRMYCYAYINKYDDNIKYDDIIKCFDKALEIDSNNSDAWFKKGMYPLNISG